jgi:hypothetical protein
MSLLKSLKTKPLHLMTWKLHKMLQTKLKEIAKIFNSQALLGSDIIINGVFTDTRKKNARRIICCIDG